MTENVGVCIPGCRSSKKFQSGVRKGHSHIRTVVMRLSWEGIKIIVVHLTIVPAERRFCLIAILISVFSATLCAQTSGEIGTYSLSGLLTPLSWCDQPAADCSPILRTALSQPDPAQNDAGGSNIPKNDWVHSWFRKVDEARANQPHYVSPIVTTHVLLVQQLRYDMSWQH